MTLTTIARLCEAFDIDVVALVAPAAAPVPRRRGRPAKAPKR